MNKTKIELLLKSYLKLKKEAVIAADGATRNSALMLIDKIDIAINNLPGDYKNVIVDLYINNLTWWVVSKRNSISENTVGRYRNKGLQMIADMFNGKTTRNMMEMFGGTP